MNILVQRISCVVCNGKNFDSLCRTPPIPVFQGCVSSALTDDESVAMDWIVCTVCGCAMLSHTLPLDVIYMGGHATSLGGIWDSHHKNFARFVDKHHSGDILEVGGGVGKLGLYYRQSGGTAPWLILEPNPLNQTQADASLKYVQGFLDESFELPSGVETIVFSHSLEHIYDLAGMIELLSEKLPDEGRLLVAWPQLETWLEQGLPGALNWEHTFFLPVTVLTDLMASHGFMLSEQQDFGSGHSHFFAFNRGKETPFTPKEHNVIESGERVKRYFEGFKNRVVAINKVIEQTDAPLFVTPASVYTQYLLAFGLNIENLAGILDNSEVKQGKRLYGYHGEVFSTDVVRSKSCTIVVNGGAHTEEILNKISLINPSATLINAMKF